MPFDLDLGSGPNAIVAVVDPSGRVIASNNPRLAPVGDTLADRVTVSDAGVLRAALAGEIDRSRLGVRGPGGKAAAASRIIGPTGQFLGVFFLAVDVGPLSTAVWNRAVGGFLTSAVGFTVLFGLLGT